MRILCFMWKDSKDQCSILNNDDMVSQALGISKQKWLRNKKEILFDGDPILKKKRNKLISKRLQLESQKMMEYRQMQAEKGRKSALTRGTKVKQRLNNGSTKEQPKGNSSSSSSSSSPDIKKEETIIQKDNVKEIDVQLTQLLITLMQKNDPNSSIVRDLTEKRQLNWINDCRLLRERDRRLPEDIKRVIEFSQADDFWKSNILSMSKLRKQFNQLWIKSKPKPSLKEKIDAWANKEE